MNRTCKYCGAKLDPNAKFCANCGRPVTNYDSQNDRDKKHLNQVKVSLLKKENKDQNIKNRKIIIGLIIIFIVFIGLWQTGELAHISTNIIINNSELNSVGTPITNYKEKTITLKLNKKGASRVRDELGKAAASDHPNKKIALEKESALVSRKISRNIFLGHNWKFIVTFEKSNIFYFNGESEQYRIQESQNYQNMVEEAQVGETKKGIANLIGDFIGELF